MRLSQIKLSNLYFALLLLVVLSLYLTFCKVNQLKYFQFSFIKAFYTEATDSREPNEDTFIFPVSGFLKKSVTKPFGIFVEPNKSPIKPERFKGFHTGIDVEFDGISRPIPVFAISAGNIVQVPPMPGRGGNLILRTKYQNSEIYAYYSHLKLTSLPEDGKEVKRGDIIAYLGESGSSDSAGERKHLHFSVTKNLALADREYVELKEDLVNWIDPKIFYSFNR